MMAIAAIVVRIFTDIYKAIGVLEQPLPPTLVKTFVPESYGHLSGFYQEEVWRHVSWGNRWGPGLFPPLQNVGYFIPTF